MNHARIFAALAALLCLSACASTLDRLLGRTEPDYLAPHATLDPASRPAAGTAAAGAGGGGGTGAANR